MSTVWSKHFIRTGVIAVALMTAFQLAKSSNITHVNSDLVVSGQAAIAINASSGGINIDPGVIVDVNPDPASPVIPSRGSIHVSGLLKGALRNEGKIQDGVFITGQSIHSNGNAYFSIGLSESSQAGLQGGYNVVDGGITEAVNDHAVLVNNHSYLDYVKVGQGSILRSSGTGERSNLCY